MKEDNPGLELSQELEISKEKGDLYRLFPEMTYQGCVAFLPFLKGKKAGPQGEIP
jgi:hypothetical protein